MGSNESQVLVDYVLQQTKLSQAQLARRLKVSRAQISKWKAGDYLSSDRTSELLTLAGLFDTSNPEWAIFAKTKENAEAWYAYVSLILEDVESGSTLKDAFQDMPELCVGHLITDLLHLGAKIESSAPSGIVVENENELTPIASALWGILQAWGELRDWMDSTLNFGDMTDDAEMKMMDAVGSLEWATSSLALAHVERNVLYKIGVEEKKLDDLIKKSTGQIDGYLHEICTVRTKYGLPITEDYFQLLYLPSDDLAEADIFRPGYFGPEEKIKAYLPYGQRLILMHLEQSAALLRRLEEKLDVLLKKTT